MKNQLGTKNFTALVLFAIGLTLKGVDILKDGKVTFVEGVDTAMYVAPKLPSLLRSAKDAVAEFKDIKKDELVALKDKVKAEILVDGQNIDEKRAVAIVNGAINVAIAIYELVENLDGEIDDSFNIDDLYAAVSGTTYIAKMTT
jgi:hypothetical protein